MNEWMLKCLERNFMELSRSIPITDTLIRLRAANVFDHNDYDSIMNDSVYRTQDEKRVAIIDKLRTRESRAYWLFCHAIKDGCPSRVFDNLHDNMTDPGCIVCNGEEEPRNCNYCTGKSCACELP